MGEGGAKHDNMFCGVEKHMQRKQKQGTTEGVHNLMGYVIAILKIRTSTKPHMCRTNETHDAIMTDYLLQCPGCIIVYDIWQYDIC